MRTLLGRVVLVVVAVALVAVVATAVVADRLARNDLDEALTRDFEAEQIIYSELATFAFFTGSWDGVDEVVDDLADEFDERVAVTDLDGLVLADSAAEADGFAPDLPPREVAFIDPFTDGFLVDGEIAEPLEQAPFPDGVDDEILATCLDELGVPYEVVDDGFGVAPVLDDPELVEKLEAEIGECFAQSSGAVFDADDPFVEVEPALLYLGDGSSARSGLLTGGPDWRLLALIAAVLVPAVILTWLAVRSLFRPLTSLGRAARALGEGDLRARAEEGGVDELASLSSQFNTMADSLEAEDARRRRFTSDIAHELRTPLANIRGYLEAAQDDLIATDAGLVDSLHDDTLLLQDLVEDLQTLSLADDGSLAVAIESVEVADVVQSTLASHQAVAHEQGVEFATAIDPTLLVAADRRRLRQVLGNLVGNAVRHTAAGGSVAIEARSSDETVVISVRDEGEGIAADDLDLIFERFARVDSSRNRATGGRGLGLAISRELVEAMGGSISATSTLGEGSVFDVVLPSYSGQAARVMSDR